MASEPKEALERLTRLERQFQLWADDETDTPVLLLEAVTEAMPHFRTLLASHDTLAAEVEAMRQVTVGPLSYTAMRCRAEAAEAKLAALDEQADGERLLHVSTEAQLQERIEALEEAARTVVKACECGLLNAAILGDLRALLDRTAPVVEPDIRHLTSAERAWGEDAALAAVPVQDVAGLVTVPRHPTREMLNAAIDVDSFKLGDISRLGFRCSPQMLFEKCWAAMIEAGALLPVPPSQGAPVERCAHCVAVDGPHKPGDQRFWLARKLMDSKLSDAEAFSVVRYHPDISDQPHPDVGGLVEALRKIADDKWTGPGGPEARSYKQTAIQALAAFQSRQEEGA